MIPVIQKEIDTFVDVVWNSHRIREQRNTLLPDGIPNHIYDFPEQYNLEDCGKADCTILLFEIFQYAFCHG